MLCAVGTGIVNQARSLVTQFRESYETSTPQSRRAEAVGYHRDGAVGIAGDAHLVRRTVLVGTSPFYNQHIEQLARKTPDL